MARPTLPARLRFVTPAVALMTGLTLVLAGCGSDGDTGTRTAPEEELTAIPQASATAPAADAKTVSIQIAGDSVSPSGEGVEVKVGQPVVFNIQSDKAGELHVHSTPEKHIEFDEGVSTITLTFDQPGVVDVEDHALDKLIVQLEVS